MRSRYLADPDHGPLPALLLVMTMVTGLVDALSIIALGRIFVANMTGNVVFLAFALGGLGGISLSATLSALAGFLVGARAGSVLARVRTHRGRLLRDATLGETALLLVALVLLLASARPGDPLRDAAAFAIAVAMGAQAATVRRLAVADMNTNVLTMTLTGIAGDAFGPSTTRRTATVLAMFAGAALGAVLTIRVNPPAALAVGAALLAGVAVTAHAASRRPAAWHADPAPR